LATIERWLLRDHPAAQGHFPGNPVIPGAVLLSEALRAIEASLGANLSPCRIRFAKFFHPARPGDRILVDFSAHDGGGIRFACTVGEKTVLAGEVTCSDTLTPA
jgi:3-hydroxyacyl-[acyl-carrier-protein] dehydratase